jgi:hypothetical protein
MARSRGYQLLRSSVKVWQSLTRQGTRNWRLWPTASRMISRPPPALNRQARLTRYLGSLCRDYLASGAGRMYHWGRSTRAMPAAMVVTKIQPTAMSR